ncbi:amidohydrolase family protein [Nocardioides piscis]|uniref:Amidohydrolase family protein n=1 Tax=Nocardioides piscis TaxID=2714938 RepID=A0A6G7YL27_9ACTN|nr:amidohydrolase family protein [Nocardioides piscis]
MRRTAIALVLLLVVGLVAFFSLAPGIVEKGMNQVVAGDLPAVSDETQALHDELTIIDMHSDTLMWDRDLLERADRGHMDLPRLEEGNVALQVFSSVSKSPKQQNYDANSDETDNITLLTFAQLQPPRTWTSLLERSLYHAEKLEKAAERSDGALLLVRTKSDLDELVEAREAGEQVTGALFSVEGLHNLEGDPDNLQALFDAGTRMAGFTHFFDNEVSGSMHGIEKDGLTQTGREVLAEMERLGIVVDIAHASEPAVAEILDAATRPVVASHGGVQATCEVNRNLSDEQIEGVAATGGVVGIGYWDAAICETTPAAVVDALEHVIEVGGIETAALGSDFDGATTVAWDTSQIAVITEELRARGHSDRDIAAIMGGNTLRVLREVLPQ